jgi:hypothetical protein
MSARTSTRSKPTSQWRCGTIRFDNNPTPGRVNASVDPTGIRVPLGYNPPVPYRTPIPGALSIPGVVGACRWHALALSAEIMLIGPI